MFQLDSPIFATHALELLPQLILFVLDIFEPAGKLVDFGQVLLLLPLQLLPGPVILALQLLVGCLEALQFLFQVRNLLPVFIFIVLLVHFEEIYLVFQLSHSLLEKPLLGLGRGFGLLLQLLVVEKDCVVLLLELPDFGQEE